ncbi:hypothetical protein B0H13DRAFT_1914907 [Mycena leptocephala]|nr:hypothetical protein B0H13DRAFT_1914907 [Mycena leptocephala]
MAITRNSSTRSSSPTPSENSDIYYDDFNSPAPSQTADALGWDNNATPAPMDSRDVTPTARVSSPTSVTEISRDEFPPLAAPTPATVTKARTTTKASKANKGKGKATRAAIVAAADNTSDNDNDLPFLAADIARATAASLGLTSSLDQATNNASSSRRPAAAPGSPAKRLRSNTAGEATPAPSTAPVAAPASAHVTAPAFVPALAPVVAPALASALAPVVVPDTTDPFASAGTAPAAAVSAPIAHAFNPAAAGATPTADALELPPMWLTADGLPPRGSRPPDIIYSPEQLLHGVPADLLKMYEEVDHPKFFMVVSGGNGAVMRTHGLIREAIGNYINIEPTAFTLGTPPTAANGTSPALWLATDIPGHLAQTIIDARIISSTSITLYTLPYELPVNGFVGVFSGFTLPNAIAGANLARELLRTAIQGNNEIAQYVQTHRDAFGPHVAAGQAWDIFLASVSVQGIDLVVNDTITVAWCLYVDPPTNNREAWGLLCHLFGKIQVMMALHGTARLQRAFRCKICPAVNHPTPLCPLHCLPGWLGLTPATITALEDASHAATIKAQEHLRLGSLPNAGGSNPRPGNGRGQGPSNARPRSDGKGKRGGGFREQGKRNERNDFF